MELYVLRLLILDDFFKGQVLFLGLVQLVYDFRVGFSPYLLIFFLKVFDDLHHFLDLLAFDLTRVTLLIELPLQSVNMALLEINSLLKERYSFLKLRRLLQITIHQVTYLTLFFL